MTTANSRSSFLPAVGAVILLLYAAGIFVQQRQALLAGKSDFSCFYATGRLVVRGEASRIYDYKAQEQAQRPFEVANPGKPTLPFVFIPFVLLIFAPLALLSYGHALALWYAINACLLVGLPFILRRQLNLSGGFLALAMLATAFFFPNSISLAQGQPTILVLILLTFVFLNLKSAHKVRAGSILALAAFKPQFVLPLLFALFVTKNWKALRGFVVAGGVLLGISIAITGWRTTLYFPEAVAAFSKLSAKLGGEHPESMPNLRGLLYLCLHGWLSRETLVVLATGVSAVAVVLVIAPLLLNNRTISSLQFAVVVLITLLASFHSYGHDLTLLLLPIFLIADYVASHELTVVRALLGVLAGLLWFLPSLELPPAVTAVAALLLLAALLTESYLADGRAEQVPVRAARRNLPLLADVPQDAVP